ncbi:MAG TPA: hypothetical protein VFF65_10355 [Phycisphaerales bacterium]|nr:hypothetical protein [Phycisphaerales bacterium]
MASILGESRQELSDFVNAHVDGWTANTAAIGLPGAQLTELKAALAATEASLKAVNEARAASLAASATNADAFADLRATAATCVRSIKAFADAAANPSSIYNLAELPQPLPPGPSPIPNTGNEFEATLDLSTGGLYLKWKASQPAGVSGVVWNVRRSINGGAFTSIGLVGEKKFTDTTVPAEALTASYTVTPQRGQQVGATSGIFQVRFTPAAGAQGAQIASVKMAA